MKISFRRITSSGSFIPEIDGLRFVAIFSVIIFHLNGFLNERSGLAGTSSNVYHFFNNLFYHGHYGVQLFFVISGFILTLPFAKWHINGGKKKSLKKYFLRRLSRLEPPYILVMTVLFFASVYIVGKSTVLADTLVYGFILLVLIALISAIFFLLVERPCMKRDWYKAWYREDGKMIKIRK